MIGLTRVAALECAKQNIRVNAICPGGTRSEMFDNWIADPAVNAHLLAAHPVGRFSDPIEQAESVQPLERTTVEISPRPAPKRRKRPLLGERPLSSTLRGEGRRTRTFNQRIKSPMLYH